MTGPAQLYHGVVTHRRLRPVGHRLAYRVFSMLIDIDRAEDAGRTLKLFSVNRFNLFSFHEKDHRCDDEAPLAARIRATLWGAGYRGDGRILLLCYPRILGYVFTPLRRREGIRRLVLLVRRIAGGHEEHPVEAEQLRGLLGRAPGDRGGPD